MNFDIVTLFPGMFESPLGDSILKRAQERGLVRFHFHNIRDYTTDKHRSVDDTPYGGGAGMVMRPEPVVACIEAVPDRGRRLRLLLSPQGERLTQEIVRGLVDYDQLVLVCGRYEGVDERIRTQAIDREISTGDFVVSGGELPAMMLIDAVTRLIPGVLGNEASLTTESFEEGMLEHPHYTRPPVFRSETVPEVLLQGDHAKIDAWRREEALKRTKKRRPDLLRKGR